MPWERCIEDKLEEARRIIHNISLLQILRDCALKPAEADRAAVPTLDGMALAKGPIMQTK